MTREDDEIADVEHPPFAQIVTSGVALGVGTGGGEVLLPVRRGDELVMLVRLSSWQARFLAGALGMAAYETEKA